MCQQCRPAVASYPSDNARVTDPKKAAARRALVQAHLTVTAAEAAEIVAVADARTAGATWEEIAEDLGMPAGYGGNAHRKYAKHLRSVVTVADQDTED